MILRSRCYSLFAKVGSTFCMKSCAKFNFYLCEAIRKKQLTVFLCLLLVCACCGAGELPIKRVITVAADKTNADNADFYGVSGIREAVNSIKDASPANWYEVRLVGMFYAGVDDFKPCGISYDKTVIPHKKYVIISGVDRGKDGVTAIFLDDLDIPYREYSIMTTTVSMQLRHLTFRAKNFRYVLHIYGGSAKDIDFVIDDCKLIHEGSSNKSLKSWPHPRPLGVGLSSGMNFTVKNSFLFSEQVTPIMHGSNRLFSKPATVRYVNVNADVGNKVSKLVWLYAQGSGVTNTLELINVKGRGDVGMGEAVWTMGDLDQQLADHREFKLVMKDMEPRAYTYSSRGIALRVESKSKDNNSKVRFDQESSAFPFIIGKPGEDAYVFKDGGNGLSGFAMGTFSVQENPFKYHKGKYITSLGKRLGDCSKQPKVLGVWVDGKQYEIIFDKNYDGHGEFEASEYSNASIVSEMKKVIGDVADVHMYDPGMDYYPEFKGICFRKNVDVGWVESGMGVIFVGNNGFRKAKNSDGKIDGICIDDGVVGEKCRIITCGEIWASITQKRFAAKERSSEARNPGDTLGVSVDTPGVFDVGAKPILLDAIRKNVLKIRRN